MTLEKTVEAQNWLVEYPVMTEQGYILEQREGKVFWVMYIEEN